MAQAYRRFGSRVTVIGDDPRILSHEDPDVADEIRRTLREEGVDFVLAAARTFAIEGRSGDFYRINAEVFSDIFMILSPEETEDLLFLYLQNLGWFVISNSRKADSTTFEYLIVNPKTRERAITHIKTGNSSLNLNDYATIPQKVFLFQSNGIYSGDASNVTCIHRNDLISFLKASRGWVPGVFDKKMEMLGM